MMDKSKLFSRKQELKITKLPPDVKNYIIAIATGILLYDIMDAVASAPAGPKAKSNKNF